MTQIVNKTFTQGRGASKLQRPRSNNLHYRSITQGSRLLRVAAATAATLVIMAVAGVLLARGAGAEWTALFRDPAAQFHMPFYAGLFSFLGIGFLIVTFAITAFTAAFDTRERLLLAVVAALSALLALDDQLMIHEYVLPHVLNLSERVMQAIYILTAAAIPFLIRAPVRRGAALVLGASLVLLAISVSLDNLGFHGSAVFAAEDLAKLIGYAFWCIFWVDRSRRLLTGEDG